MDQKDLELIKSTVVTELEASKETILKAASDAADKSAKSMVDLAEKKIALVKGLPSDVSPEDVSKLATDFKTMVDDWAGMEKLVKDGRFAKNGEEGKSFTESFAKLPKKHPVS